MEIAERPTKTEARHRELMVQLQALENQRAAIIQEILRIEGEMRVLKELRDGAKPGGNS